MTDGTTETFDTQPEIQDALGIPSDTEIEYENTEELTLLINAVRRPSAAIGGQGIHQVHPADDVPHTEPGGRDCADDDEPADGSLRASERRGEVGRGQ